MTFLARWLPLAGLALFAAVVVYLIRPPQPVAATAPATAFAAGRAQRALAVIARRPHSIGTPANASVRDYLVRQCQALGLQVSVQDTSALSSNSSGQVAVGRVQNIVARLPGRLPGSKAVLVLAHYDSQPHTPGAGDDGAGVAAMLETIRALRAGPPLAHPVIWLFTDGEEAGLLGARAYAADTARLRREVGVVLNFEGRGNRGPSLTFEVNPQNGWIIREYARAAAAPLASSLFYEVYRQLPNDTDFTPLRQAGLAGLNFAYLGGYSYYHSPADTPAHLDAGSLQHQGDYMLSLVRHFGSIPLTQTKAPDYTFFNPLGHWLVLYPAAWNLPLTLLTVLVLLAAAALARQRGRLSWASWLGGAAAWLGALLLMLAAGWGLLAGVAALYPHYKAFYDATFYNAPIYQIALLALGGAVFTAYYGWLSQRLRIDSLVGGALLVAALLLGLLQWRAASSAFLLAFPLLFASLGWLIRGRRELPSAGLVNGLLALPAVALLGQYLYLVLVIFGSGLLALLALVLLAVLLGLGLPVLLPVLQPRNWLAALSLAGVAITLAVGHANNQPTAEQPQQTHLYYALDADHGRAYWLSALARPDAWTRQLLTQPQYGPLPALYPGSASPVLHQVAPRLALAAPQINILTDSTIAGQRHVRVLLRSGRPGVRSLRLSLPSGGMLRALHLAGHSVPAADLASATLGVTFYAPRPTGEILDFELASAKPLQLIVTSRSLGLPAAAGVPSLPATFIAAPGYGSFSTQVKKSFSF